MNWGMYKGCINCVFLAVLLFMLFGLKHSLTMTYSAGNCKSIVPNRAGCTINTVLSQASCIAQHRM